MQGVQALEVDVAAIHDVVGARLGNQQVEDVDVVNLAVGDFDEGRDVAAQVDQGMQLDRRLGRAERRPRKQRQAQVDRGRVQRVDGRVEIDGHRLADVELARLPDQNLGEVGVDAPVAALVGVRQRRSLDRLAKTHVVELR